MLHTENHSLARRYAVAAAYAAGAVVLRWLLEPVLGDQLPLSTVFGFVALSVWYGGWGPALLTSGLSYLAANWLFIEPRFAFNFDAINLWGIVAFLSSIVVIIGAGEAMRRAQHQNRSNALLAIERGRSQEAEIRERQRAEQALRASEDRLRLAQQAGHIGAFEWNIQTGANTWTPELETMYGLRPGEFEQTQRAWENFLHPEDRDHTLRGVEEALETGEPVEREFRIMRPDGELRWMTGRWQTFRDINGTPLRLIGVNFDVTDRKRRDEALRRSEAELAEFFEHASVGIHWVGPDGTILRANRAELDLLGYLPDEYIGHHITEFHADQPVIEDILARLQCNETLHDYPARLRCKDGSIRDVLINSNVFFEDGRFIHTRCFTREVTERKQAERALAHLAAIVTSSDDAIVSKTLDGIVTSWNHSAERLFGFSAEEMIGQPVIKLIPPDRYDEEWRILDKISKGERVDHYHTVRRRKDGTHIHVSLTISPLVDSAGKIIGASKIARDITQQKRAEEALRDRDRALTTANDELNQQKAILADANKELQSFSYSVSHDLRAPLRTIGAYVRILEEDCGEHLNAEARRCLHIVKKAAAQAGELIDDLLEFSRLGRIGMDYRPTKMTEIAREVADELKLTCGDRAIDLTIGDLPPCHGDWRLLKLVWTNLLANAFKFTRDRPVAQIQVGWLPDDRQADATTYFVKDNGVGFDMKYVHKLFGVFQRLHLKDEFEGTGVGLAIAHRIVLRHEGRIWAEGKIDGGATFFFSLRKALR